MGRLVGGGRGCARFWLLRVEVALEIFEQGDDFGLWRGSFRLRLLGDAFRRGLQQERLFDVDVEEMFRGGEARGVFGRVGEAGDVNDDGVGGFFGAQAFASFDATLAEGAGEAEDSGDGLDVFLLLVAERRESAAVGAWLRSAMEADSPAEEIPLFVGPARRHRKLAKETARGFAAGFACGLRVADSADTMEPRGGAHDAAHVLLAEGGCGVCAAQSVEKRDREMGDFRGAMRA